MSELLKELEGLLGEKGMLQGEDLRTHPACAWIVAKALIRPKTTEELSAAMKLCHQHDQQVVTQGGRTGLVGGQNASEDEIIVSLERMNQVVEIDEQEGVMIVEAGVPLQSVQEAAEKKGFLFPLDLGARGTATIGGTIATNAGGNRVVRYGMMREMVLGFEAVLSDGTILSSMNEVIKNNTGYDLKQLFIGSEGTLGIVTRAVLRMRALPKSSNTALVAVSEFSKVIKLLRRVDKDFGGGLSSFEVMWQNFYQHILTASDRHTKPLSDHYPYYVIIEQMGANQKVDDEVFETSLMALLEDESIDDAVICKSEEEREAIWNIRDDVVVLFDLWPIFTFDVSLPLKHMEEYVKEIRATFSKKWPESSCIIFGHLGDGNIHIVVSGCGEGPEVKKAVEEIVYDALRGRNGVISAEHGIGVEKKPYLEVSRSAEEIFVMRQLKTALDPKGILNRGKLVDLLT